MGEPLGRCEAGTSISGSPQITCIKTGGRQTQNVPHSPTATNKVVPKPATTVTLEPAFLIFEGSS